MKPTAIESAQDDHDAVVDDVVQDTWIIVIRGIASFQERSSLKTWVYGILVNVARRRAQREGRTVPFASAGTGDSAWAPLRRGQHPRPGGVQAERRTASPASDRRSHPVEAARIHGGGLGATDRDGVRRRALQGENST
jgi:DNA-directed RNA polymerase specialized sigma24 family protein